MAPKIMRNGKPVDVARLTNIRVVDGDSIEGYYYGDWARIRMYGIDAPELSQRGGPESADRLTAMVARSGALMFELKDIDHYGRLVGIVYPVGGSSMTSLNRRMVAEGYAYAYTRFGGRELRLVDAERAARSNRLGVLWQSGKDDAERPWDYRQRHRGWDKGDVKDFVFWAVFLVVAALILLWVYGRSALGFLS